MNSLKLGLVLSFMLPAMTYAGGLRKTEGAGHVGGGDAIACDAGGDFQSRGGLYSLDYAVAIGSGAHFQDFASIHNWQESNARIASILARVSPRLKASFDDFSASVAQLEDPSSFPGGTLRRWWADKGGSGDFVIADPKRGDLSGLPQQCTHFPGFLGCLLYTSPSPRDS